MSTLATDQMHACINSAKMDSYNMTKVKPCVCKRMTFSAAGVVDDLIMKYILYSYSRNTLCCKLLADIQWAIGLVEICPQTIKIKT